MWWYTDIQAAIQAIEGGCLIKLREKEEDHIALDLDLDSGDSC